jgi:glycosyltransferase involved in cell wall biosynthesis
LGPLKDPVALVNAAGQLRDAGLLFRIIIAGSATPDITWYAHQFMKTIERHKLTDVIETPGWVEDVSQLYRRAAIGVQTSHTEGLSMTLLEQMMAGLAIVATDVGDTSVAIENERTGLLIPPGDEAALVDALTRLITDHELRLRLGHAARTEAIRRFTCRAMATATMSRLRIN